MGAIRWRMGAIQWGMDAIRWGMGAIRWGWVYPMGNGCDPDQIMQFDAQER